MFGRPHRSSGYRNFIPVQRLCPSPDSYSHLMCSGIVLEKRKTGEKGLAAQQVRWLPKHTDHEIRVPKRRSQHEADMSSHTLGKQQNHELLIHTGALHDPYTNQYLSMSIDAMHEDLERIQETSSKPIRANYGLRVAPQYLSSQTKEPANSFWCSTTDDKCPYSGTKEHGHHEGPFIGIKAGSSSTEERYGESSRATDSATECASDADSDRATRGSLCEFRS